MSSARSRISCASCCFLSMAVSIRTVSSSTCASANADGDADGRRAALAARPDLLYEGIAQQLVLLDDLDGAAARQHTDRRDRQQLPQLRLALLQLCRAQDAARCRRARLGFCQQSMAGVGRRRRRRRRRRRTVTGVCGRRCRRRRTVTGVCGRRCRRRRTVTGVCRRRRRSTVADRTRRGCLVVRAAHCRRPLRRVGSVCVCTAHAIGLARPM